ncbi:hypothetical protein GCM10009721_25100 [Terrabacter tumescens]|uniref:DUF3040 domain-containing protein n=1 Tax=Terrabacter tumescens TaxID=60443 RepID=A0ABQ2I110_9MICO|nr:hypothetical protein [Terrabacter tumescens]GGM97191.1 hypothetical protein GCM10009721_25100 [Terrabacter tumescens]
MSNELQRLKQDEAVTAAHDEAVARGEKRVLRRTTTGELHSYPADEIGFTPGRGQAQVRTWWGMAVLAVTMALLSLLAVVGMFVVPMSRGDGPQWGGLVLVAMGGLFTWYAVRLARDEYRAKQVRRERGSPEPGA